MQTNYKKQQKSGRYQSRTPKDSESRNDGDQSMDTKPFFQNQGRKPLHASSLFPTKDNRHKLTVIRRTSTIDFQTKSLKDLDLRGNSIRTRNFINRKDEELQQGLESQYNYNQNLVRLKIEEMIFKFKTRIGTLLKEMSISVAELNRFTGLSRIDDIIDFLSEKVKELMMNRDIRSTEIANVRSKDQEILNEYEVQIDALKKRQQERENVEKGYKERLKEAHGQIRQLYDRINRRQKQLSSKMTEIYQAKAVASESDKVVETLKQKCANLVKECASLRESNCTQNKKIITNMKKLQDQNIYLEEQNEELSELVQRYEEKEKRMIDLNRQLNEELERWRERFESHRNVSDEVQKYTEQTIEKAIKTTQSIEIKEGSPSEGGKYSELTLLNQNSRLTFRTMELQKQNRQLSREYAKYTSLKEKYTELLTYINSEKSLNNPSQIISSDKSDNKSKQGFIFQIQFAYKKKIQENAKQWREKLIEIVNTYEEEAEKSKQDISDLIRQKEQLKGEVQELAIMKYKIENELIEKEREIYHLNRLRRERQNSRVTSSLQLTDRRTQKVEKGDSLEADKNGDQEAMIKGIQVTEQKGIEETEGKEEEETLLIEQKTTIVDCEQQG